MTLHLGVASDSRGYTASLLSTSKFPEQVGVT